MAEAGAGQQRAFVKNLNRQTAQQIRESATATVKAMSEQSRPKLRVVEPIDYEAELSSRRKELGQERYLGLMLFPQHDVEVMQEDWKYRTELCTVPPGALDMADRLFTAECLRFFQSKWHIVNFKFSEFSASFGKLLSPDFHQKMVTDAFESDVVDEEGLATTKNPASSGAPLTKRGYLSKGPFPSDGGISVSMKTYRKRYAALTGDPNAGGYFLNIYKDEKCTNLKGRIALDTCTEVKTNVRHKTHGFDILTDDEKVFYPLAGDSDAEVEEWAEIIKKAIAGEVEESDGPMAPITSYYTQETLRDLKKTEIKPEHLQVLKFSPGSLAEERNKVRYPLFQIYPELLRSQSREPRSRVLPPEEKFGLRFVVKLKDFQFKLSAERDGHNKTKHLEPFFLTLALFDAQQGVKLSEDFHVNVNSDPLREMLPLPPNTMDTGPHPLSKYLNSTVEAVFSVSQPHEEVYLVARIEKVLQGGITACAEPYVKLGDAVKSTQRILQQVPLLCSRLGAYHMPFAWAARPVFQSGGNKLDLTAEFTALYKQERERLGNEELLKILADFKNIHKAKLQTIPGSLVVDVVPQPPQSKTATLTSSLLPVRSRGRGGGGGADRDDTDSLSRVSPSCPPCLEVQEFLGGFHAPRIDPHLSLTHHLYVYPVTLKYDSQKAFAKARNISCWVQFKSSDVKGAKAQPVIYSSAPGTVFCDGLHTTVLHHCTSPTFYTEVKLSLPIALSPSHHLLFTFYHIACDIAKTTKAKSSIRQPPPETIVGYAWLPLVDEQGRLLEDTHSLPVASNLPPNYLQFTSPSKAVPDIKWVDGHRPIFRVDTRLQSTIYTQDSSLHEFFSLCEQLKHKSGQLQPALHTALERLAGVDLHVVLQFLPILLTQLFHLLSNSSRDLESLKAEVVRTLVEVVDKVVEAGRSDLLKSYIEHIFVTEVDVSKTSAVHDDLASLMVLHLRQGLNKSEQLLQHLWFFLEVMLKSMTQYLGIANKMQSSRKSRYLENFGWNLRNLVAILLEYVRQKHHNQAAKKANRSLAKFIKQSFNFMDRGVVFKLVAHYMESFSYRESPALSDLKLEFLTIICEHEHFIPLNLPFPVSATEMEFSVSDEYYRKHFLTGVLLREIESALQYEAGAVRKRTIRILRGLLAKHDCDSRYKDLSLSPSVQGQMGRIAQLYFPLVPIVLSHVSRLNSGQPPYISPMLGAAAAMHRVQEDKGEVCRTDSPLPRSLPGSLPSTLERGVDPAVMSSVKSLTSVELAAAMGHRSTPSVLSSLAPSLAAIEDLGEGDKEAENSITSDTTLSTHTPAVEETLRAMDRLSVEETRDLLVSVLFVLKYTESSVLLHWWSELIGSGGGSRASGKLSDFEDPSTSRLSQFFDFFNALETCLYSFKYCGRTAVSKKLTSSYRESTLSRSPSASPSVSTPPQKEKLGKKTSVSSVAGKTAKRPPNSPAPTPATFTIPRSPTAEELALHVKLEGALSNEVGLIILGVLDTFMEGMTSELSQAMGDNYLMAKFFTLLITMLHLSTSATLQSHIFSFLRVFIHNFRESLFKGSAEYCGILCFEILRCCNSKMSTTRSEACSAFYLMMKTNNELFRSQGFVRCHVQATIAVSRLVSTLLGESDTNLRRSLTTIANFVKDDTKIKRGSAFPTEVAELMKRLKTILNATSQMKAHQSDPEKLMDLHYSLAKSYSNSPELRQTWLDSMTALHLKAGNYSEAAHCSIHIAGVVAECLKLQKENAHGCAAFTRISPNIEMEERGIREDKGTAGAEDHRYTQQNLVSLLETSMDYFEQAQRYEVMSEVAKLLQPFYEDARDSKSMMEMYGKLHQAYRKVVDIEQSGRRYLGTYFRVAFFGRPFGDDHEKQYVYKEPAVTTLAEIVLRLQKLYSRKFGPGTPVNIVHESGRVDIESLASNHANIQITHVEPYFTEVMLQERPSQFERANNLSRFVFEAPFTREGKQQGDVTRQCMRKTVLTTSHWFPYIKKRIPIIHQEQFEFSPIEVAIEAMQRKTSDLVAQVQRSPPDLKRLQLLLQGCVSTQVNQGVQEYAVFLSEQHSSEQSSAQISQLKTVYRSMLDACQHALDLNESLISTDQLLYHQDMKSKFQKMLTTLNPLIADDSDNDDRVAHGSDTYPRAARRSPVGLDPHRMSAILFSSISGGT